MLTMFEVQLVPGVDGKTSLPAETIQETSAQLMTYDDIIKLGFSAAVQPGPDENFIWITVSKRDAARIHRFLETNENVINLRMFDIDD